MKRITTIVLFASIFAVAVGTLGLSGNATTLMISAAPQTQDIGMLGHVEYTVLDEFGEVKSYMQNDNVVVTAGKDCAAQNLFFNWNGQTDDGECIANAAAFTYIGIGNWTSVTVDVTNQTLGDSNDADTTGTCASQGVDGDMARRNVTASTNTGGTTRIVTLDTSNEPFTFDLSNKTTVFDSGIFNADYDTPSGVHTCGGTNDAGTDWNMFARQLLNDPDGITVGDGDSLSVKWTINVN